MLFNHHYPAGTQWDDGKLKELEKNIIANSISSFEKKKLEAVCCWFYGQYSSKGPSAFPVHRNKQNHCFGQRGKEEQYINITLHININTTSTACNNKRFTSYKAFLCTSRPNHSRRFIRCSVRPPMVFLQQKPFIALITWFRKWVNPTVESCMLLCIIYRKMNTPEIDQRLKEAGSMF